MKLSKKAGIGLLIFTAVCFCLAIIIGLTLHYTLPRTIIYVSRTDTVGNCIPEKSPDEVTCQARRYAPLIVLIHLEVVRINNNDEGDQDSRVSMFI